MLDLAAADFLSGHNHARKRWPLSLLRKMPNFSYPIMMAVRAGPVISKRKWQNHDSKLTPFESDPFCDAVLFG